tara:strand:+ start:4089 stop:4346 length:258 start_codon:yes stop_codon:yes gene_type:complete
MSDDNSEGLTRDMIPWSREGIKKGKRATLWLTATCCVGGVGAAVLLDIPAFTGKQAAVWLLAGLASFLCGIYSVLDSIQPREKDP